MSLTQKVMYVCLFVLMFYFARYIYFFILETRFGKVKGRKSFVVVPVLMCKFTSINFRTKGAVGGVALRNLSLGFFFVFWCRGGAYCSRPPLHNFAGITAMTLRIDNKSKDVSFEARITK